MNDYVMARSATAEEFHCAMCNRPKKAKAKATRMLANGSTEVICNQCYGYRVVKTKDQR